MMMRKVYVCASERRGEAQGHLLYGHLEPVLRLPMGKLYLRIYNMQLLDPLPIVDLGI
jgi:hypothetical protein